MRPANDAVRCWEQFDSVKTLPQLRDLVRNATPHSNAAAGLRSLCWKAFFLFEGMDRSTWAAMLADSRAAYTSLRDHLVRPIEHPEEYDTSVDPLSETAESPWEALRKDEALRAEIFQDVERCMPENVYFRQPAAQKMLLDILFIYCKLNMDVGYRQGMHEILAPVLWVVESDSVDVTKIDEKDGLMAKVLDSKYIEHDTFTLFSLIMQNAKSFYTPASQEANKSDPAAVTPDSPMIERSKRIYDTLLPKVDPGLYEHLTKLEIVPQIFLMRWVRLLFGREFPFDQVLDVWDLLFAEDPSLELVDLISVAMLLRIRWELVEADTNEAFTLLLRYPAPTQPAKSFVQDAIRLRWNLNQDTGADIIAKHTGRQLPLIERVEQQSKSSPRRPLSAFGSPERILPSQPRSLEAILQDAAKGVYSRSEKLGLNKAVRDAVGEFKKNIQQFNSVPAGPRSSSREYRRTKPPLSSTEKSSAELLRRIMALETRNKELAIMLENSVSELWEYQASQAEKAKEEDKASLEALSTAIAKVQFVQVYLDDPTIPLSTDDAEERSVSVAESSRSSILSKSPSVISKGSSLTTKSSRNSQVGRSGASSSRNPAPRSPRRKSPPSLPQITDSPPQSPKPLVSPASTANSIMTTTSTSISITPSGSTSNSVTPSISPHRQRPSLASSSFSWMLGEEEPPTKTFAHSTSPHNAFPVEQRRKGKGPSAGKGFLFGEEDESIDLGDSKTGKGRAQKAPQEIDEEVIDLGPLGSAKGSVV